MKNIHLIPTEKPSRFSLNSSGKYHLTNQLHTNSPNFTAKHIYITSNEEIKDGDWCYQVELNDGKVDKCYDVTLYHTWTNNGVDKTRKFKKIILTSDQDLIKEGVQAIDDEFLEWFVKNPSCEEVEVERIFNVVKFTSREYIYKIIIPKEELKQEKLEELMHESWREGVRFGSEWEKAKEQERMYSEEEVISFLQQYRYDLSSKKTPNLGDTTKQWFEQFKKK